jgi:hypothetical protein
MDKGKEDEQEACEGGNWRRRERQNRAMDNSIDCPERERTNERASEDMHAWGRWDGREGADRDGDSRMSSRGGKEESIPDMPREMFAAGENHPTVAKALALERLCRCGAVALARRRESDLLWVGGGGGGGAVGGGLAVGVDGRDMA